MTAQPAFPSRDTLLPGIQLLRGCSALLVVVTHANLMMAYPQYFGLRPFDLHESGLFGVAIFFVISGFIIALVSLRDDGSPRLTRAEFARRRFFRIVPFLWVSVIAYNLLSYAGAHTVEWWSAIRALVVWPVAELKPNIVWSLRHEFLFYALFACLMLGRRSRIWPLVLWFLAPAICWPLLWAVHYPIPARIPEDLGPWQELFQVVLLGANSGANLQFGAGFLLGWLSLRKNPMMAARFDGLHWALLAVVVAAAIAELAALPVGLARDLLWTVLAAPCVWLGIVSTARGGWLSRVGNVLGNASFALYLVHNGVLLAMFAAGRHLRMIPVTLLLPLFVAGAVAVGLIAHHFVEKPLIASFAHGRRLVPWTLRRRSGARPASASEAPAD